MGALLLPLGLQDVARERFQIGRRSVLEQASVRDTVVQSVAGIIVIRH